MIETAYFVTGETRRTMSASWSPSCRSGSDVLATVVSNRTWPDR